MKFAVENISKCVPRLGILKEIERNSNLILETPLAMLYTRGGSIPHITNEVYKLVYNSFQIIQIPLVSTYNFEDVMTEYQGNIAEFVGMKECISCMTVQDPGDSTLSGHHMHDFIPIWTRQGKVLINAKSYMNSVELFKPDMYYFLSDGDTNIASPVKRINKAVNNTIMYHKQCLERHEQSKILQNTFVMGAISGGFNLKARKTCIDAVCNNSIVNGFLIDGLHNNGPEVEFITPDEIKSVVEFIVNEMPEDKLRAVHGCWNPVTILQFVQLGVDLFDTSYCHIATERSCALTFALDPKDNSDQYELNLRQSQFADDFRPILAGCTCLACTKYSRGYIHHLVSVQELLGPLLLTIHNVHHYMRFFSRIRECIRNDSLKALQEKIKEQFYAANKQLNSNLNKISSDSTETTRSIQDLENSSNEIPISTLS